MIRETGNRYTGHGSIRRRFTESSGSMEQEKRILDRLLRSARTAPAGGKLGIEIFTDPQDEDERDYGVRVLDKIHRLTPKDIDNLEKVIRTYWLDYSATYLDVQDICGLILRYKPDRFIDFPEIRTLTDLGEAVYADDLRLPYRSTGKSRVSKLMKSETFDPGNEDDLRELAKVYVLDELNVFDDICPKILRQNVNGWWVYQY